MPAKQTKPTYRTLDTDTPLEITTDRGTRKTTAGAAARLLRGMDRQNRGAIVLRGLGWVWPVDLRNAASKAARFTFVVNH
jgi:hypothetical protein